MNIQNLGLPSTYWYPPANTALKSASTTTSGSVTQPEILPVQKTPTTAEESATITENKEAQLRNARQKITKYINPRLSTSQ